MCFICLSLQEGYFICFISYYAIEILKMDLLKASTSVPSIADTFQES